MLPPDKSDAVAWATYTSRQQSLRSLQSTQSLPKVRTLSEAEKTDLVRIIVPSLTPFTLHAKQSIGYILGIRKEKHAHVSSVWRKLSKRGRTIAYLLTASLLFFPQIVFTLSLDGSYGFAWVGITALAPVTYLALLMNVRVLGLTFSQFEARFLGVNVLAWIALLYYGVRETSVRVGALSMLADALLLMFWDALPQFFRHERALSLVLPISAMFIWQSFVAFFHGIRLDETSLRFVGIDFRISARLSAFAATTGIYGLGHVERWLSTKNDDFSTIRVPAKSIKIPKQALEELSHCLREVRLRARKRSGSLFSRKLRRGSQIAQVTPGPVLQRTYSNDLIRAASSASSSEESRGAESSPFTVLAARAPLQISTGDTIGAYWFGPRIGDAVFEWNKKLGYLFFLIFQAGHFIVLWCMQPGGAWAWWLLYVMAGLPALAWFCVMNRFVLRMVVKSFEFKFMLLNIGGFCVTVTMAMQDKRAAAATVGYLLSTGLGLVMDAFPRAMLTFTVRIMLGIPNLVTLSILVYQISAGTLHPFKSQQACLTKGACITQADLASGFGINIIAFFFGLDLSCCDRQAHLVQFRWK